MPGFMCPLHAFEPSVSHPMCHHVGLVLVGSHSQKRRHAPRSPRVLSSVLTRMGAFRRSRGWAPSSREKTSSGDQRPDDPDKGSV